MAKGRVKMIEAAARLIHKQGYHATGLAEVVDKSGAPRGSIYHYFPRGKNQLVEEAIESACSRLVGYLEPLMAAAGSPVAALDRLAQEAMLQLEKSGFKYGCPFVLTALEAGSTQDDIRQRCAAAYGQVQGLIRRHACPDQLDEAKAEELSLFLFSSFQGAFITSQTLHDVKPLQMFRRQLPALLAQE